MLKPEKRSVQSRQQQREEVIAAYKRSGLNQSQFSRKTGVALSTLSKWLHRNSARTVTPLFAPLAVVDQDPPALPIAKSIASPGLLAQVLVSKYDDHLPLYRQAEMWQRLGIELSRASLSNWMIQVGQLLSPLVALLKGEIVSDGYVRADETPTQVLKQTQPTMSDNAYMWVYMTGSKANSSVVYDYQPSRKGDNAKTFPNGFQGYLQTDGYKGYACVTAQEGVLVSRLLGPCRCQVP